MNVNLTARHDSETCTWCEKTRECVTADFGNGFIRKVPMCWGCLQKAVKVHAQQESGASPPQKPAA